MNMVMHSTFSGRKQINDLLLMNNQMNLKRKKRSKEGSVEILPYNQRKDAKAQRMISLRLGGLAPLRSF